MAATMAMVGDLLSSFVKRRLKFQPSSRATGLDQIPESSTSGANLPLNAGLERNRHRGRGYLFLSWGNGAFPLAFQMACAGWTFLNNVCQLLECKQCNVISGGQLKRTGTTEEPTPTDVYPIMSRYSKGQNPYIAGAPN